jgi:hypothetical protein
MASEKGITRKKGRDVYSRYRTALRIPRLGRKKIVEIRQALQVIARAVCEHVWGKKFY